jgi:hypothetical protein
VTLLFLGATTSSIPNVAATDKDERYDRSYEEPYQQPYDDSYGDSYNNMYSKYPTKDNKFVCKYGPLEGVFVKDKKFYDKIPPPTPGEDIGLQCEECINYWSHTLNQGQFRDFINDLAEWINSINFDFTPSGNPPDDPNGTGCSARTGDNPLVTGDNPNPNVECLPIAPQNQEQFLAQVFEICEQFDLAVQYIADERNISISQAFEQFATGFLQLLQGGPNCNNQDCRTAIGLLDCFRERVIPLLEEDESQPILGGSSLQIQQQQDLSAEEELMNILLNYTN